MKTKVFFVLCAFSLLIGNAYAAEVDDCINKSDKSDSAYARCWLDEAKRLTEEIKQKYVQLSKVKAVEQWNNGNGLFKGNLKDMMDSWVAYRNRFCSLSGIAGNNYTGEDKSFHQAQCLVELSKKHNVELDGLLGNITSYMTD